MRKRQIAAAFDAERRGARYGNGMRRVIGGGCDVGTTEENEGDVAVRGVRGGGLRCRGRPDAGTPAGGEGGNGGGRWRAPAAGRAGTAAVVRQGNLRLECGCCAREDEASGEEKGNAARRTQWQVAGRTAAGISLVHTGKRATAWKGHAVTSRVEALGFHGWRQG